ncbi:MAG: putative helicase/relaxase [Gammaproteobacteria bacterium]|jgi:hypothetical protein|nr:putative helicase/relaxase [Gammaproteobacteria bacterium]
MSTTMFKKAASSTSIPNKKLFSPKPYRIHLPMLLPIQSSKRLLQNPKITHVLPQLQQIVYTTDTQYQELYLKSLESFAEFVQQLPSRRNFHFNHVGGTLLLGLLRAFQTIRLYREQTPIKSYARDKVPANIALWSYALYTAALFLGVGEIYATYWVSLCDAHGEFKQRWQPKTGPMTQYDASHYRYSFEQETRDAIAHLDTLVVAEKLLPKEGLEWIASDKYVYELWSAILTGDNGRAGPFAGLILPTENILLEQHQDLIESLEDFLLHEQRELLDQEHHEELVVELTNIDNINDLSPEQQQEIQDNPKKLLIALPDSEGKPGRIYVNLTGVPNSISADMLFNVLLGSIGAMSVLSSYMRMVASGLAISSGILAIFSQAFPEQFNALMATSLGTTRAGETVFDPTALLKTLPRQAPLSPQNELVSTNFQANPHLRPKGPGGL